MVLSRTFTALFLTLLFSGEVAAPKIMMVFFPSNFADSLPHSLFLSRMRLGFFRIPLTPLWAVYISIHFAQGACLSNG